MNKKADMAMNLIVAAAIALVVLIVVLAILTGRLTLFNKFNPDKDICLSRDCIYNSNNNEYYLIEYKVPECIQGTEDWILKEDKYTSWRPKNKCEFNAMAEGCICDEYKNLTQPYMINMSYDSNNTPENRWKMDITYNYVYGKECIKSHIATLDDFNCTELKKHIFLEDEFCINTGLFFDPQNDTCFGLGYNTPSTQIKKVYIAKGCEI